MSSTMLYGTHPKLCAIAGKMHIVCSAVMLGVDMKSLNSRHLMANSNHILGQSDTDSIISLCLMKTHPHRTPVPMLLTSPYNTGCKI